MPMNPTIYKITLDDGTEFTTLDHKVKRALDEYEREIAELKLKLQGPPQALTLWEEAGKFADQYKGEGWLRLRGLMVDFHLHMKEKDALQSVAKDGNKI